MFALALQRSVMYVFYKLPLVLSSASPHRPSCSATWLPRQGCPSPHQLHRYLGQNKMVIGSYVCISVEPDMLQWPSEPRVRFKLCGWSDSDLWFGNIFCLMGFLCEDTASYNYSVWCTHFCQHFSILIHFTQPMTSYNLLISQLSAPIFGLKFPISMVSLYPSVQGLQEYLAIVPLLLFLFHSWERCMSNPVFLVLVVKDTRMIHRPAAFQVVRARCASCESIHVTPSVCGGIHLMSWVEYHLSCC